MPIFRSQDEDDDDPKTVSALHNLCSFAKRTKEKRSGFEAKTHYPGARFSARLCWDAGRGSVFFVASNPERISVTRRAYSTFLLYVNLTGKRTI